MDIIISARHMDLTDAMKNSVHSSLEGLKHSGNVTKAEVVLDASHNKYKAEIVIHGTKLHLDAKAETDNMYEAIDKAVDRLQKQVDKQFGKMIHSHRGEHLGELEAKKMEALVEED